MMWAYDAGQPWSRRKHGWAQPVAGFVTMEDQVIAKCPRGMTQALAQQLINAPQALPLRLPRSSAPDRAPDRIFVFHAGVLYRCMPTVPGVSYHGFPELPQSFDKHPRAVKKQVWEWARRHGFEAGVEQWLSQT